VALLSPLILREANGKTVVIGMILALLGGMVVGVSDSCTWQNGLVCPPLATFVRGTAFFGDFLALCGAWAAAGYVMIGRRLRSKMSLIPYIFVVYGMAAIVLLIILGISGERVTGYLPMTYLWLLLLALVPQLLGHSTFNWALRYLPASLVSITLLGEPIGSTILAYLILKEAPTPLKIVGALLILAGIYVASLKDEVKSKK
jgi:drug/metabolite transporter (DMT)-like permease